MAKLRLERFDAAVKNGFTVLKIQVNKLVLLTPDLESFMVVGRCFKASSPCKHISYWDA